MNKRFKLRSVGVAALMAGSGSAMAQLPREVTGVISSMQADGILLAGAFLIVCVAIAAVKILKKGVS